MEPPTAPEVALGAPRRADAAGAPRDSRGPSGGLRRRAELCVSGHRRSRCRAQTPCTSGSRTRTAGSSARSGCSTMVASGHRIGRVATLAGSRGRGYSGALLRRAIELSDPPIVLSAQAYLVDWYARFGFEDLRRALDRGRHRARADAPRRSSGDDVDDAVDDRDHLARRTAVEQLDDARMRERQRGQRASDVPASTSNSPRRLPFTVIAIVALVRTASSAS